MLYSHSKDAQETEGSARSPEQFLPPLRSFSSARGDRALTSVFWKIEPMSS